MREGQATNEKQTGGIQSGRQVTLRKRVSGESAGRSKALQSRPQCFFAFSCKPGSTSEECSRREIFRCWEAAGREGNLIRAQRQQLKS